MASFDASFFDVNEGQYLTGSLSNLRVAGLCYAEIEHSDWLLPARQVTSCLFALVCTPS